VVIFCFLKVPIATCGNLASSRKIKLRRLSQHTPTDLNANLEAANTDVLQKACGVRAAKRKMEHRGGISYSEFGRFNAKGFILGRSAGDDGGR